MTASGIAPNPLHGQICTMRSMQTPRDEAWEAMTRGDYEVALKLYEETAAKRGGRWLNGKAGTLLCLRRFEEARNTYAEVQRGYERNKSPYSGRCNLAVATWLCGDRASAIDLMKTELLAIERGRTGYLDRGFGVNEGVVLYYFGAASRDRTVIDNARDYLEGLSLKPLGRSWPPGLLEFLLDKASEEETREIVRRDAVSSDMVVSPEAEARARAILMPKAQKKFDFCRAVKIHERDGARAALALYSEVARGPNPSPLNEWCLARSEAEET